MQQDSCALCGKSSDDSGNTSLSPACKCPGRLCHRKCLARYQFKHSGTHEEVLCLKCKCQYPDWTDNLTSRVNDEISVATLRVRYRNEPAKSFTVCTGVSGLDMFKRQLRRTFNIDHEPDILISCTMPGTLEKIKFRGWQNYKTAVYCAFISQKRNVPCVDEIMVS